MRIEDAQPDEIAVITGDESVKSKSPPIDRPSTPGGHPIPITVVEKADTSSASSGELPGTGHRHIHNADAAPDLILESTQARAVSPDSLQPRDGSNPGDIPIPTTKVEKIDSIPSYGEVPGTDAREMRKGSAEPEIVEEVGDLQGKKPHLIPIPGTFYDRVRIANIPCC